MGHYARRKVTQDLKQSGRVLLSLTAQRDGSLYGSAIWAFRTSRQPQEGGDPSAEGAPGAQGAQEADELPYHRFSHRDALLLSYLAGHDFAGDPTWVHRLNCPSSLRVI